MLLTDLLSCLSIAIVSPLPDKFCILFRLKDFLKCNDYKSLTLGDTETTCNGVCNEHPGRASVEPPKFKPDGNWMCQAQCGNGGCNYPNKENCICDKPNTPCYGLKLGDDITLYDSECNTNPGKCRAVHCEQEIPVCPP